MKPKLLILFLFSSYCVHAQMWVKTRTMDQNNSITEYRWIDTSVYKHAFSDTIWIHDTVCPCCPKPLFQPPIKVNDTGGLYFHPPLKASDTTFYFQPYANVQRDSAQYGVLQIGSSYSQPQVHISMDSIYWSDTTVVTIDKHHKKHKTKKHKLTKMVLSRPSECIPDTVAGTIAFNDGTIGGMYDHGNNFIEGYWIGCSPPIMGTDKVLFIPGRYKKTGFWVNEGKKTKGFYFGVFVTKDFIIIPNWRVYGLFINLQIKN